MHEFQISHTCNYNNYSDEFSLHACMLPLKFKLKPEKFIRSIPVKTFIMHNRNYIIL